MRLLAIQPGAIGDFILSLPALAALREMQAAHSPSPAHSFATARSTAGRQGRVYGVDAMEVWAERVNLTLLREPGVCASARPLAETGFDSWPLPQRTLDALRQFDIVVSWRGARLPELIAAVQAGHPRAHFLEQFPAPERRQHLLDFRREQLLDLFGDDVRHPGSLARPPSLLFSEQDLAEADAYLARRVPPGQRFVVLHPGASGPRKQWGGDNFADVAKSAVESGRRVFLSEGPLDRDIVNAVMGRLACGHVDRLALNDLRVLGAVLSRAELFVGNDTGIAHLAAASGARTIAVFVATDPAIWAPRGENVTVLVTPTPADILASAALARRT